MNRFILLGVCLCAVLFGITRFRQEPNAVRHELDENSRQLPVVSTTQVSVVPKPMYEQMHDIQAHLDKIDPSHSFVEFVFVGKVLEVRPLRDGDIVVGKTNEPDESMAIIQVTQQGATGDPRLARSRYVAVPVGNIETVWQYLQKDNRELLFEYGKSGKFEHIYKYGC